jgi:glycosyltransferase involved in cell wall biosynthesis
MCPLVTVLINNYNYGRFLRAAIDSALNQTYKETEVIVVDDGSIDNSREIIATYCSRIVPVLKQNGGQASAFNAGFAHSRGEWISFLDADDIFLPCKLELLLTLAQQYPQAGLIAHSLSYCDVDAQDVPQDVDRCPGRIARQEFIDIRKEMRRGKYTVCLPATTGLLFRRDLLVKILPMPDCHFPAADNYVKVAALGLSPVLLVPEVLAKQRLHGRNRYTGQAETEDGKLMRALGTAQVAYHIRQRFPLLARLAWKEYGRALCMLALRRSQESDQMRDYIRSNYSLLEYSPSALFFVGGAFFKKLFSSTSSYKAM